MNTHPRAPGDLELVRAFANTLDVEDGVDALSSSEGLMTWCAEHGFHASHVTPEDRQIALVMRDALRGLLRANHGESVDPAAVAALNQAAADLPLVLRVRDDASTTLVPRAAGVKSALARILAVVFGAMADGAWPRLKICRSDTCQWAFYDYSRNRSGSWCSMAVCGNRTKVRNFQARARARSEEEEARP